MPAAFLFTYAVARRFALKRGFNWVFAAMLVGVWLTGGLFMALSATASGGGFAGAHGVGNGLLMALLGAIPPITFIESVYDGGGLALLAVTIGPPLIYGLRTNRVLHTLGHPPR